MTDERRAIVEHRLRRADEALRHFVRTDRVPRALAQIYNDLFARRVEGDYVDFVRFEAVQVQPWMEDAEAFVRAISALVGQQGRAG